MQRGQAQDALLDDHMQAGPSGVRVVLINPYELGRQPFALAEPAAWLRREGFEVTCVELSQQRLSPQVLDGADLVAIYLGMHTATRIAMEALPRIRELAPQARLCAYGLYAPMNAEHLRELGVGNILGGEVEPELVALARRVRGDADSDSSCAQKVQFITPDRSDLPSLATYAHLRLPDGTQKVVGFTEATRGCKHVCRHCPVVPVYEGRFRAVPLEVVMADIRQQVAAGAEHISFGDPDFFNGPTHALRVVRALHAEFPEVTYDATIKVSHLVQHAELLAELHKTGCLFITSAVESLDDRVLEYLAKNHTREDFFRAVSLVREAGIALAPTFIPFTPWTRIDQYIDLLATLVDQALVESVPTIQLAIRLLVPRGSHLLKLEGFSDRLTRFDPESLGYVWHHEDPAVDALQRQVQGLAEQADAEGWTRREAFEALWQAAHDAAGRSTPVLPAAALGEAIPAMSENWYCCAEPTQQQLSSV